MTAGCALRLGFASGLVAAAFAGAIEPAAGPASTAEVRVMSLPGQPTILRIQAEPDAQIDDRTPGAHPPVGGQGAASTGETFSDEISFVVRGKSAIRQAAIDVEDALVSTVRLFPDRAGMQVVVFVRQPVTYSITRPSAAGTIEVTLRPRTIAKPAPAPGEPRPKAAKPAEKGEDQVAVDAAELAYDQQGDVLIARGGVTLTRGDMTLRADEVRYDRTKSIAEARGHVVLIDPEASVEGDAATLHLEDETGWIDDVQADMKRSPYRLTAGHVEKRGGPCYGIRNGVFTTCRCGGVERPSWSIEAEDTDVTLGGVGVSKDAKFRVNDLPVLYVPYLLFPANTDRQSGFLIPRVSFSNRRGFVYEQPIYWAIDKSSDATIITDVETEARLGIIGEYRYAWSKRSRGAFTGGYFNESIGGTQEPITQITKEPVDVPTDRWVVAGRHRTLFAKGRELYLDVLRISDENFLREIRSFASNVSSDIQIRSTRVTRSRLGLQQTWDTGAAQVEATAFQDLIDPQRFALDRLPRVAAEHGIPLLGGLAVARVPAEVVNFQREVGYDGLRMDLGPELFVPFRLSRYLFGSVRGQVRETAYHLTNTDQVALVAPKSGGSTAFRLSQGLIDKYDYTKDGYRNVSDVSADLDTDHTREIAQVNGRLATEFARVFSFPFLGLDRIRHSIEPEVQYLFVPQVGRDVFDQPLRKCNVATNNPKELGNAQPGLNCNSTAFAESYLFDEVDAINRRNFVSYGITTRILGRFGAAPAVESAPAPEPLAPTSSLGDVGPLDDDELDEQDELDDEIDTIDADTIPQGLPAAAVPPYTSRRPSRRGPALVSGAARELLRASILQGYDISRNLSGDSHLSAIDAQLRVTPVDWLGFSYNTSVDVDAGRMLAQSVGLVLREPWWQPPAGRPSFQSPSSIGVAYRFIADDLNAGLPAGSVERLLFTDNPTEGIDGSVYLRVGDYLGFGFLARYQLSESTDADGKPLGPRFLERDYFLRLTSPCACWAVEVGVSDRSDTGEVTSRVQLVLYGLGSFGQGPGRRGTFAGLPGLQNLGLRRPSALGRDS